MRRSFILLFAVLFTSGAHAHGPHLPPKFTAPKKPPDNLKVLPKSFSARRVSRGMKLLSKGLGVKCSASHLEGDYAKDDRPAKIEARKYLAATRERTGAHGEALASLLRGSRRRRWRTRRRSRRRSRSGRIEGPDEG